MAGPFASETLRRCGAGLLLLALAIAAVLPPVLAGKLFAPGDGLAYYFPIRALAFTALKHGEMPFWNPYFYSGTPLMAGIQPGIFFPGNWTFLVLPPIWAWHVTLVLALFTAGAGAYAFARSLALPRLAALVTGVSFMLSGYMANYTVFLTMLQTAGLLGFLLWAIERHARTCEARYAIAGAGILALMVLAGHPQTGAYCMLIAGAYAVFRGFGVPREERLRYGARLALMGGLGLGLTALQLLPTLDLIQMSQRQAMPYARLILGSLPLQGLPTLLFPFLYGANEPSVLLSTPRWASPEWMRGIEGYGGAAAWALAAIAVTRILKDGRVRFWVAVAGVGVVLAMGGNTPVYKLWAALPVVKMMPFASRHLLEFAFALAVLAGLGMAAVQRQEVDRRRWLAAAALIGVPVAGVLAAVGLFGPAFAARTQPYLQTKVDLGWALSLANPAFWLPAVLVVAALAIARRGLAWTPLVVGLLAIDGLLTARHLGRYAESPKVPEGVASAVSLTPDREASRVFSIARWAYPYNGGDYGYLAALRYPAVNILQGAPSVSGFDAFILKRYGDLLTMPSDGFVKSPDVLTSPAHHAVDVLGLQTLLIDPKVTPFPLKSPPLSLAGERSPVRGGAGVSRRSAEGKTIAVPGETPAPGPSFGGPVLSPTGERGMERHNGPRERWLEVGRLDGMRRFENQRALPYAWRVVKASVSTAEQVEVRMTTDAGFAPRLEALVEVPVGPTGAGTASARPASLNRITVETEGAGPGLVAVAEGFDPGWRAFAGGRELPVHRLDGLILGIEVPAGRQTVTLDYAPRTWPLGAGVSGLSALGLLVWGYRTRRRAQRDA